MCNAAPEFKYIYLGYEIEVGNQCRVQNDRHVGSVEQLDWV
jgi:hypothetical protein